MIKILIACVVLVNLFGCNTVAGFGRDIQGSAEYMHGRMPGAKTEKKE